MDELIAKLVPLKEQAAAARLLEDADTRNLIRQQLSQLADDHAGLISKIVPVGSVQAGHFWGRRT